ncbi:hypothetical protein AB6E53_16680 [Vibrio breoganii]
MNNSKTIACLLSVFLVSSYTFAATTESNPYSPKVFLDHTSKYNTLDGLALDNEGNIIASVPNLNNDYLIKNGTIETASPPVMAIITKDNQVSDWYKFKPEDMHQGTGRIGPMECAFGPDGNLYIADMQVLWDGNNASRVLRINIVDGKPVDMDVVVEGFNVANGLTWKDDTLFVTESILVHEAAPAEGEKKAPLRSGVYAFSLEELQKGTVTLSPYSEAKDPHLVAQMVSSNRVGFGADGLAVDDNGNLYTSIMEDGVIYKTSFDEDGKITGTKMFTDSKKMVSSDGILWDSSRQKLYVADILNNAVHSVGADASVETLHQNADTSGADGSLDQPVVLLLRDDQLIVVNMDIAWITPKGAALNTEVEAPFNLSVIDL